MGNGDDSSKCNAGNSKLCNDVVKACTILKDLKPMATDLSKLINGPDGLIVLYVKVEGRLTALEMWRQELIESLKEKDEETKKEKETRQDFRQTFRRDIMLVLFGAILTFVFSIVMLGLKALGGLVVNKLWP